MNIDFVFERISIIPNLDMPARDLAYYGRKFDNVRQLFGTHFGNFHGSLTIPNGF